MLKPCSPPMLMSANWWRAHLSQTRMNWYNQQLADRLDAPPLPRPTTHEFDRMIAETQPDTVIVTTMDRTHHEYITRAMTLGCDVITEKPMTTDLEKLRANLAAIDATGKSFPRHLQLSLRTRLHPVPRVGNEGRRWPAQAR